MTRWLYKNKLARAFAVMLVATTLYVFSREYLAEIDSTYRPQRKSFEWHTSDQDLGFTKITIRNDTSDDITGYYRPADDGRTIILLHGSDGNRESLMPEGRILAAANLGVLSLDLPGHGESGGTVQWNEPERLAVTRAIDWLEHQAGVNRPEIGIYAFSMGTLIGLQAAVMDKRVHALALAGAMTSVWDTLIFQAGGPLFVYRYVPWFVADFISGTSFWNDQPADIIAEMGGCPILLISGTSDQTIPSRMSDRLYAKAHDPKFRLSLDGAGHGDYLAVAPERFSKELVGFFKEQLVRPQNQQK
jgi:uncharacterized protein